MKKMILVLGIFFLLMTGFFAGRFFSGKEESKTLSDAAVIVEPQKKHRQSEKVAEPQQYGEIRIKGKF